MDFRNNKAAYSSRGLRNNNPGNFRPGVNWQGIAGSADGYLVFTDVQFGIRAMALNLYNNYYLFGKKDLLSFITKYAPSSDGNNPLAYANEVAAQAGITAGDDMQLSFERTAAILRAMMNVELSNMFSAMVTDEDLHTGINMIGKFEITALKTAGAVRDHSLLVGVSATVLIVGYIYFVTKKSYKL